MGGRAVFIFAIWAPRPGRIWAGSALWRHRLLPLPRICVRVAAFSLVGVPFSKYRARNAIFRRYFHFLPLRRTVGRSRPANYASMRRCFPYYVAARRMVATRPQFMRCITHTPYARRRLIPYPLSSPPYSFVTHRGARPTRLRNKGQVGPDALAHPSTPRPPELQLPRYYGVAHGGETIGGGCRRQMPRGPQN